MGLELEGEQGRVMVGGHSCRILPTLQYKIYSALYLGSR
jgi:hypothetical protein